MSLDLTEGTDSYSMSQNMFRPISILLAASIFLWVLPLGAFIQPSQEKMACGGNRAFHMCSCATDGAQAKKDPGPQKISFTSASGMEKTNKADMSSGGNDFLSADMKDKFFGEESLHFWMSSIMRPWGASNSPKV